MKDYCGECKKQKRTVLGRQYPDGHEDALCKECADVWLNEDSDFPKRPKIILVVAPPHGAVKKR